MSKFIIETEETVRAIYEVEADSKEEAKRALQKAVVDHTSDWDSLGVDQRDYMAFEVTPISVTEVIE